MERNVTASRVGFEPTTKGSKSGRRGPGASQIVHCVRGRRVERQTASRRVPWDCVWLGVNPIARRRRRSSPQDVADSRSGGPI